jgi:hypothetical protein
MFIMKIPLLNSTAIIALMVLPSEAIAQASSDPQPAMTAPLPANNPDMEVVVVRGSKLPESVPGDVKPEVSIGTFEIRTSGASSLPELLQTLLPQTQSGRRRGGNRPIILVNARRIGDFSEIRALPMRAIKRVEIYPEEVALRYGFPADQKVVNIILVGQFNSTGILAAVGKSAGSERDTYALSVNGTNISTNGRTTYSVDGSQVSAVTEEDLAVSASPNAAPTNRTLLPMAQSLEVSGAIGRALPMLGEQGYGSIGIDIQSDQSESIISRATTSAGAIPTTNLRRDVANNDAKVTLNSEAVARDIRWSGILTAFSATQEIRVEGVDTAPADKADQTNVGASFDGNLAGPVKAFAAGPGSFSLNGQLSTSQLDASFRRGTSEGESQIDRSLSAISGSLSLPLASRRRSKSAIGDVSVSTNVGLSSSSDFGGSGVWGLGVNWSPTTDLQMSARYDASEQLPSLVQLGGPLTAIPGSSFYDARTNSSVRIDIISGGNGALAPEKLTDLTLGVRYAPSKIDGLNLSATYARNETEDFVGTIGVNTNAAETAFGDRYTRNRLGALVGVDNRALNLGDRTTETVSMGLSFTRNFGQAPKFLRDVVERVRKAQEENPDAAPGPGGLPAGMTPPLGFRPPSGARPDFREIAQMGKIPGGRWNIGINYAYTLDDSLILKNSDIVLDLLDGGALDTESGARHQIILNGGVNYRGFGGRLAGKWRSDSEIDTGYLGERLFVEDQLTLDLTLYASTELMPQLNMMMPFLRRSQIRFEVTNLTDSTQEVTTSSGTTPIAFQSQLIDPTGRAFRLSFKKQF